MSRKIEQNKLNHTCITIVFKLYACGRAMRISFLSFDILQVFGCFF